MGSVYPSFGRKRMKQIRCAHCGRLFDPNPRVKNQRYCSEKECQRVRKKLWQRHKLATDPDYKDNQKDSQKTWRENNPDTGESIGSATRSTPSATAIGRGSAGALQRWTRPGWICLLNQALILSSRHRRALQRRTRQRGKYF